MSKTRKILGIQILGAPVGDFIGEWVAELNSGMKLSSLTGTIHPYPTLGDINKRVAGSHISPKICSPKIKKALKLLFSLQGVKK